jgi:thioredoxin 1
MDLIKEGYFMANVKDISATNFETEVTKADQPVLVDFWAPWCGPCKMLGPIVETLAEENVGKIRVGKLNVDENQALAGQFGVRSIPTLIFFKSGKEVKRVVGAQGKSQLQKFINEVIG